MILTPYILTPAEPIKMRYLKLREKPLSFEVEIRSNVVTLDLLPIEESMHILLSHPDWDQRGLARDAENICSSLLALMSLCGLIKERDHVRWYELSFVAFPEIRLQPMHFTDDGQVLSAPVWGEIPLKDAPFNLSELTTPDGTIKKA